MDKSKKLRAEEIIEVIDRAWLKLVSQEHLFKIKEYPQNKRKGTYSAFNNSGFAFLHPDDISMIQSLGGVKIFWNKSGTKARPIELNGLYDNNGWTKIYSAEDLPYDKERYDVYDADRRTGVVSNITAEKVRNSWENGFVTHFRKVDNNLPIY